MLIDENDSRIRKGRKVSKHSSYVQDSCSRTSCEANQDDASKASDN